MTTKVTITNDGPYVVEAFAVTRGSDEIVDHSTKTIELGKSQEFYLWADQSIRIVEPQPARTVTNAISTLFEEKMMYVEVDALTSDGTIVINNITYRLKLTNEVGLSYRAGEFWKNSPNNQAVLFGPSADYIRYITQFKVENGSAYPIYELLSS